MVPRRKLGKLKPSEKTKDHVVFDIESNDWIKFEMAGVFDGNDYFQFDSTETLVEELLSRKHRDRIIFAHNGGRFDFLFLFDELVKRKVKVDLIQQGARLLTLKIHHGDRHYTKLQDSYALLPASLSDLCKSFAPEHAKLSGTIDFETEKVSKTNSNHTKYLEHDCRSLYEILKKYSELPIIKPVGFKGTLASTALSCFRVQLKKNIFQSPDFVQAKLRETYAGGRVEIYKNTLVDGYAVDANSLFPTVMRDRPLPIEYLGTSNDCGEFGFHEVTVEVPDMLIPVLWQKSPKLIFPTGTFRGIYFSEEIKLAVKYGAKIIKQHKGFHFSEDNTLFTDYINQLYQLRLDNPNTALSYVAKMLMNNTYGKFAQNEVSHTTMLVDPNNWSCEGQKYEVLSRRQKGSMELVSIEKTQRRVHMNVHIASAITAWARIKMYEDIYHPLQNEIAYTDTDSGFIKSLNIPIGCNLGEYKMEYEIKNGFFMLPKGYMIEKPDGSTIVKIKGISKKVLEKITRQDFLNRNFKENRTSIATFKTALIRKNSFLATINNVKSINAIYDKRLVYPDGSTRPWHYRDGQLI